MAPSPQVARDGLRASPDRLASDPVSFQNIIGGLSKLEIFTRHPAIAEEIGSQFHVDLDLILFSSGCHTDFRFEPNCTVACADPKHVFGSLSTLANCVTLSAASILVESNVILESSLDTSLLRSLGIGQISEITGTGVLSSVVQCAAASCRQTGFGNCSEVIADLGNSSPLGSESLGSVKGALSTYCDNFFYVTINADIAGPGVLLSLVLQTVLVMGTFGLIYFLNLWVRHLGYLLGPTRWAAAKEYQHKLRLSTLNAALISAAMEFQEAQAFFTLAIQVATFVTFRPVMDSSSLASIGESIMNLELVRTLAVNGILPILLMQSVLQRTGMKWSYNLVLVFSTFVFALIADSRELTSSTYETLWDNLKHEEHIAECGGNPTLMAFCLTSVQKLGFRSLSVLQVASPTIMVLTIDQLLSTPYATSIGLWVRELPFVTSHTCWLAIFASRIVWCGLEGILVLITSVHIFNLKCVADGLGMSSGQWSYGQVVSAMIWAPVLGKLVYYNFLGVKHGIEARLLPEHRCSNNLNKEEASDKLDA
ncbi:hypothetical protein QBC44DRAFT_379248 [Cladorrhinum sp. PSN332]|nr:hypothetical protein QBC44DRAFT_379248 [Cladorrhinum sp. PSN332]